MFERVKLSPLFSDANSSLFSSLSLSLNCKEEEDKESAKLDRSSGFHDDEFVFYFIIVVLGVLILGVRGILRASLRGENQPLVYDFPVGDVGGFKSVDAVGETIYHAMRVFTVT